MHHLSLPPYHMPPFFVTTNKLLQWRAFKIIDKNTLLKKNNNIAAAHETQSNRVRKLLKVRILPVYTYFSHVCDFILSVLTATDAGDSNIALQVALSHIEHLKWQL